MIKPTRGNVLISPIDEQEKTASGLVIPDSAKEKPQKGTVIAIGLSPQIGRDARTIGGWSAVPFAGKEGDKVIYNRWAGKEVKDDGKEYIICKFEDILGIVE